MDIQPGSRSPCPAPCSEAQPGSPGRPKPLRLEQPRPLPSLEGNPGGPQSPGFTSLVALAPGCALKVPLSHVDVVLEPGPASILTVNLPDQRLFLVPEDLLACLEPHPGKQGDPACGMLLKVPKDASWEEITIQEEVCCESVPEVPLQEEACVATGSDGDFMQLSWSSNSLGPVKLNPDPHSGHTEEAIFVLEDFQLSGSVPGSPLQPLAGFPRPRGVPV
ncbi:proline-rich protein 23A-like [Perognathus longimembris pacificus]|uniref:proline-rich protein 23A-like n=1 Tax=Perognathus longimembris pacificus TaxID=214514 RepID=UPI002019610B|nr:proline-rich protein 23A-like [Perognathus longimembris pacificus]